MPMEYKVWRSLKDVPGKIFTLTINILQLKIAFFILKFFSITGQKDKDTDGNKRKQEQ